MIVGGQTRACFNHHRLSSTIIDYHAPFDRGFCLLSSHVGGNLLHCIMGRALNPPWPRLKFEIAAKSERPPSYLVEKHHQLACPSSLFRGKFTYNLITLIFFSHSTRDDYSPTILQDRSKTGNGSFLCFPIIPDSFLFRRLQLRRSQVLFFTKNLPFLQRQPVKCIDNFYHYT